MAGGAPIPYMRNPRKNDAAVDKMCAAIREFGCRIPVMARSDGAVVDGHLRLKAAKRLALAEVAGGTRQRSLGSADQGVPAARQPVGGLGGMG
ncbi:MAG: ParB N-terminal domain-containing protein [Methylocella sp.]